MRSRYGVTAALLALLLLAVAACGGDEGETATDGSTGTSPTAARRSGTTVTAPRSDDTAPGTTTAPAPPPPPPTSAPATTGATPAPPPPPTAAPAPTTTTAAVPPDQVLLSGTVCTRPSPGAPCAPGGAFLAWGSALGTITGDAEGRFQQTMTGLAPGGVWDVDYWATTPTQTCTVDPPGGQVRAGTALTISVACTVGPAATITGTSCTRAPVSAPPGTPCSPGGFFGLERVTDQGGGERWLIGSTPLGGYPAAGEQRDDGTWTVQVAPGRYTIGTMTSARVCSGTPDPVDVVAGATVTIDVTCSGG